VTQENGPYGAIVCDNICMKIISHRLKNYILLM